MTDKYFSHSRVKLPSRVETDCPENNFIYVDCYYPRIKNPSPPVLFLHHLGMGKFTKGILLFVLKSLARNRSPLLFITLPYHMERLPLGIKSARRFARMTDKEMSAFFAQGVADVCSIIDWWKNKYRQEECYIAGASLGALISIIAMALDPRIKKGVFINGGGNYEEIVWNGILGASLFKDCDRKTCRLRHRWYLGHLDEIRGPADLYRLDGERKCFLYDPLTYASWLKGRELLFFNSLFDLVMPRKGVRQVWKRAGRPAIFWLPSGHFGISLFWWYIERKIRNFLYRS